MIPNDWSADGRFIVYTGVAGDRYEPWILPLAGEKKPFQFELKRYSPQFDAAFAPNNRWLAYPSMESGQSHVLVQPFPPAGFQFQVSKNGGSQPLWRGAAMAVSCSSSPPMEP